MRALSVYIGAAIDQSLGSADAQYNELKELIKEALGGSNFVGYSPYNAFFGAESTRTANTNRFLVDVNLEALLNSDIAVFIWSDSPSFGVPAEILHCNQHNIPFVVWNKSTKPTGIYLQHAISESKNSYLADSKDRTIGLIKSLFDLLNQPVVDNKPTETVEA